MRGVLTLRTSCVACRADEQNEGCHPIKSSLFCAGERRAASAAVCYFDLVVRYEEARAIFLRLVYATLHAAHRNIGIDLCQFRVATLILHGNRKVLRLVSNAGDISTILEIIAIIIGSC